MNLIKNHFLLKALLKKNNKDERTVIQACRVNINLWNKTVFLTFFFKTKTIKMEYEGKMISDHCPSERAKFLPRIVYFYCLCKSRYTFILQTIISPVHKHKKQTQVLFLRNRSPSSHPGHGATSYLRCSLKK